MRPFQRRPLIATLPPLPTPVVARDRVIPVGPSFADVLPDSADDLLAASETEGRIARTTARLLLLADELEARHVRYTWTERLAEELRNIAHDTASG